MGDTITLRGFIVSQYGSIRKFAKAMQWSYSKTYRVVSKPEDLSLADMRLIKEKLGVTDPGQVLMLFSLN